MDDGKLKIFKLNRIKFNELYADALAYIQASYKAVGQAFNTASPFGQLLQVVLNLGRMIFYYIEDSITGLNIRTAYRADQIKGLARLTGHDAARTIAARGAVKITYIDNGDGLNAGKVCYIPNKIKVVNRLNNYTYTLLLGADNAKISMQSGNYIEASVIQGEIKMQSATGTGMPLQSYNFAERNFAEVDQYYVNVYVNGELWEIVGGLQDLGYMQKGCIVKTGINSGVDIYFGNGQMGAIPVEGASITVEYVVADGNHANIIKDYINSADYWQFQDHGYLADGTMVDLNQNFQVTCLTDIIFGTTAEDTALTQAIAPHVSRSFVLANEANYKYFFQKMNMFSDIEIIKGSYSISGSSMAQLAYDQAQSNYDEALESYKLVADKYDANSSEVQQASKVLTNANTVLQFAASNLANNSYRDNTIYIFLVPDINKRISSSSNYFNCDETLFYLSEDEQANILNLINASGQRIITMENRIIQPKVARFALNVQAKIWETANEDQVYATALQEVSNYLLSINRKDMIPISDMIALFENIDGIDSVNAQFVPSRDNQEVYGANNYGVDSYGDIILYRTIIDNNGQVQKIRDIMPLVRGGFVSVDGISYSSEQSASELSAFNLTFAKEKSSNKSLSLTEFTALT